MDSKALCGSLLSFFNTDSSRLLDGCKLFLHTLVSLCYYFFLGLWDLLAIYFHSSLKSFVIIREVNR